MNAGKRNKKPVPANEKKLRRKLAELAEQVRRFIACIDQIMTEPESHERGKKMANLCNQMALYNDAIRYFWCDVDYRKDTRAVPCLVDTKE